MPGASACLTRSMGWRGSRRGITDRPRSAGAAFSRDALVLDHCCHHLGCRSVKVRRLQITFGVSLLRQPFDPLVVGLGPLCCNIVGAGLAVGLGITLHLALAMVIVVVEATDKLLAIIAAAAAAPRHVERLDGGLSLLLSAFHQMFLAGAERPSVTLRYSGRWPRWSKRPASDLPDHNPQQQEPPLAHRSLPVIRMR